MLLIYRPDPDTVREYRFVPAEVTWAEREAVEDVGGSQWDTWEQFAYRFMAGGMKARRVALWLMLRRESPRLQLHEVAVAEGSDLLAVYDDDEAAAMRAVYEAAPDIDEETRAMLLDALDQGADVAEAVKVEAAGPKASGPSGKPADRKRAARKRSA